MFVLEHARTEYGGERGIRTLGTLLTYTRFPGVRLQPLGHLTTGLLCYRGNKVRKTIAN